MDLDDQLYEVERKYAAVSRKIDIIESSGNYGSGEHEMLVEQQMDLEAELQAIHDEIERG